MRAKVLAWRAAPHCAVCETGDCAMFKRADVAKRNRAIERGFGELWGVGCCEECGAESRLWRNWEGWTVCLDCASAVASEGGAL